jgi:hypothetical protein
MANYNLILGKGVAVIGETAPDVLRELADLIDSNDGELLSVGITYNQEQGDYTAYALYE